MTTQPKPHKRPYRSKPCARCQGYGIVMTYEQNVACHNSFAEAMGVARTQPTQQLTTQQLTTHAGYLFERTVPMLCPDCRNAPEAVTR